MKKLGHGILLHLTQTSLRTRGPFWNGEVKVKEKSLHIWIVSGRLWLLQHKVDQFWIEYKSESFLKERWQWVDETSWKQNSYFAMNIILSMLRQRRQRKKWGSWKHFYLAIIRSLVRYWWSFVFVKYLFKIMVFRRNTWQITGLFFCFREWIGVMVGGW